jgi:hypothetical protein
MDMALTILCWVATNLVNCHSVRKRAGFTSPPYPPRSQRSLTGKPRTLEE